MTNLTPDEQAQIKAFIANPAMLAAVLRVLQPDEDFAEGVPTQDDAAYGRAVRAWVGARDLMQERINDLKRIASSNPQGPPVNEVR